MMKLIQAYIILAILLCFSRMEGQSYWQQSADYKMVIDFDAKKGQYVGEQWITYTNNSEETLNKIFYHLYFNAFQPGSMMDVRSRTISDPDSRVRDRISKLKVKDRGLIKVSTLEQNGQVVKFQENGTILEVELANAILPGQTAVLHMKYFAQVPQQIRRSGKNNKEGIDYSMTQWYPKLCEFDEDGWHPNPYVGREFYGVWGNFDVTINIDSKYIIGGTGILVNADEIGYGYSDKRKKPRGKIAKWHFKAENVHDFAWAADPDYTMFNFQVTDGPMLHMIYQKEKDNSQDWEKVAFTLDSVWAFIESNFGDYAYPQYTIIQGGDGGMEYPMCTLITGKRKFSSLLGVTIHELMHSWYQAMLGTDEARFPYMDEGFTTYASGMITKQIKDPESNRNPMKGSYEGYKRMIELAPEEPLSTHADHYRINRGYSIASYVKGAILIDQLKYIVGSEAQKRTILSYYKQWSFKHPDIDDFIRVAERESDMVLDWYKEYWVNSTKTIDYAIDSVYIGETCLTIRIDKVGEMPMPIDLEITLLDNRKFNYNIPLSMMRGDKLENESSVDYILLPDWPWTNASYEFCVEGVSLNQLKKVKIDPKGGMADIHTGNNEWPISIEKK